MSVLPLTLSESKILGSLATEQKLHTNRLTQVQDVFFVLVLPINKSFCLLSRGIFEELLQFCDVSRPVEDLNLRDFHQ
jgi:hypothetical protein